MPATKVRPDVIAAATKLFSQRGFHGTSMQHIADALGIRKASLYHHVRSKEDLLYAIHEELLDQLIEETVAVVSSAQSPEEKLKAIIYLYTRIVAEDVEAVTVLLKERDSVSGERWTGLVAKRDLFEQMVRGVVGAGVESGAFVDRDPGLLTKTILALPGWTATWYRSGGPVGADELAELYADVAINGIVSR
ncbi:MAG: TetR/AcrR family transcriptional regulator [Solirubrobacterales bacterium]